ncbi:MAG: GTPase-activating protein, partial [Planctomycetota bacterium]
SINEKPGSSDKKDDWVDDGWVPRGQAKVPAKPAKPDPVTVQPKKAVVGKPDKDSPPSQTLDADAKVSKPEAQPPHLETKVESKEAATSKASETVVPGGDSSRRSASISQRGNPEPDNPRPLPQRMARVEREPVDVFNKINSLNRLEEDSRLRSRSGSSASTKVMPLTDPVPASRAPKQRAKAIDPPRNQPATIDPKPSEPKSGYVGDGNSKPTLPLNAAPQQELKDYTGRISELQPLSRTVTSMQRSMASTLRYYYRDVEIATRRSNWGMLHAIMVYGIDTKVRVGRQTHSTVAWIAGNNACRGQRLFTIGENGNISAKSGVGLQGHQGQLLAIFSLCGVPRDYPIYAGNKAFSIEDVIAREQADCREGAELTFTLIGLSHYLSTDATWKDSQGNTWDFERVIREELGQPVVGSACGGTHRLMGFAHALRKRRAEGKPIDGQWKRADKFLQDFVGYAYRLQNRDGSFSTNWFEGREDRNDVDRKIQTTGHIVEWLLTITPDEQLQNTRLVSAVNFLNRSMSRDPNRDWSIGPKGHALRSLAMYYDRVYDAPAPWKVQTPSRTVQKSRARSRR